MSDGKEEVRVDSINSVFFLSVAKKYLTLPIIVKPAINKVNIMIINCLIESLRKNECVVVPEFGAFITQTQSASLNYITNRFTPPHREIVFNSNITADDDAFARQYAETKNISLEAASKEIHDFAMQTLARVEAGDKVEMKGLGILSSVNGQIIFKAEDTNELLDEAFGLKSFTAQPILRLHYDKREEQKEEKKSSEKEPIVIAPFKITIAEEDAVTRRHNFSWVRSIAATAATALILFILAWHTDRTSPNLASAIPFFYSSPNEYICQVMAKNTETIQTPVVSENSEEVAEPKVETVCGQETENNISEENGKNEVAEENNEIEATPEVDSAEVIEEVVPHIENHYFIIGASCATEAKAASIRESMISKGFSTSVIMFSEKRNTWRVTYEGHPTKEEALPRLEAIRAEYDETAWLLFQK